jgi:hypothetical protein
MVRCLEYSHISWTARHAGFFDRLNSAACPVDKVMFPCCTDSIRLSITYSVSHYNLCRWTSYDYYPWKEREEVDIEKIALSRFGNK